MNRSGAVLTPETQRAVLRGDCYYCWLGQFDKCDANCNNYRAIPRYGNNDITPAGRFKPKASVGNESYHEWLSSQAARAVNMNNGAAGSGRDGRLSRFEILQAQRQKWATRDALATTEPPKLASLSAGADAGGEEGSGETLSRIAYYGGGGNNVLAAKRSNTPNTTTAASRDIADGDRPAHLQIHSCRLPIQPVTPHKHAAGSVRVQVTPYSFAEFSQRSAMLANERQLAQEGREWTAQSGPGYTYYGGVGRQMQQSGMVHGGDADENSIAPQSRGGSPGGAADYSAIVQNQRQARDQQSYYEYNVRQAGGGAGPNARGRSASAGASRVRSASAGRYTPSVQRGKGGVVLSTAAPTNGGGPVIKVRSDDTSSYILSAKVQSVKDMPLPALFQGLDNAW